MPINRVRPTAARSEKKSSGKDPSKSTKRETRPASPEDKADADAREGGQDSANPSDPDGDERPGDGAQPAR